ncbi:uncharacterized protein TNCV_4651531 [Trichonephila clavipes]|nr:uncharacterized protein TNCV_4651531 [Trichonephila clavipes]
MASNYKEMMKAKGFLPYHLDTLPDKFIQIAKEELGETNEIRGPALEQFRKRILAQKKTHILHFDFDLLSISFSRSSTRHAIVTPDKLIFDMAGASDRQSTSIASPSFINSPSAKAFHN